MATCLEIPLTCLSYFSTSIANGECSVLLTFLYFYFRPLVYEEEETLTCSEGHRQKFATFEPAKQAAVPA